VEKRWTSQGSGAAATTGRRGGARPQGSWRHREDGEGRGRSQDAAVGEERCWEEVELGGAAEAGRSAAALEVGAHVELERKARSLGTRGNERVRGREGGDGLRDLINFGKEVEGGGCKKPGEGLVELGFGWGRPSWAGAGPSRWLPAGLLSLPFLFLKTDFCFIFLISYKPF
jgi:hypothetical protein